jgi:hypothetical protein
MAYQKFGLTLLPKRRRMKPGANSCSAINPSPLSALMSLLHQRCRLKRCRLDHTAAHEAPQQEDQGLARQAAERDRQQSETGSRARKGRAKKATAHADDWRLWRHESLTLKQNRALS